MREFLLTCAALFVGLAGCFGLEEWKRHHPSAWRRHFASGLLWTLPRRKGTR